VKVNRSFGETYRLRLQRWSVSLARNQHEAGSKHSRFFAWLTFLPRRWRSYFPLKRLHSILDKSLLTEISFNSNVHLCIRICTCSFGSRDSVIGIATGYGLDEWGAGVPSPGKVKNFSILHVIQRGCGAHPMGTGDSFHVGKAARAWSWPLTSSQCRGQENVYLHIHSPIRLHGAARRS
jgi:hypothetical protein